MAKLKDVIYLSNEDYDTLVSTGTVTIDGDVLTYDESNVYITPEVMASSSQDGLMSAADKVKLDGIEAEMANYLPLTGGTLSLANADSLKIKRTAANSGAFIKYYNNNQDTNAWYAGMDQSNAFQFQYSDGAIKAKIDPSGVATLFTNSAYGLSIKRLDANAGAFVNYYNNNQSTNYWQVGMRNDGPFSFAYNGSVMASISTSGSIYENGTSLADKYAAKSHTHDYLPLTGGTLNLADADSLKIKRTSTGSGAFIAYYNNNQNTNRWFAGMDTSGSFKFNYNDVDKAYIDTVGNIYENGTSLVNKYAQNSVVIPTKGIPRTNLGNPTVYEMGIIDSEFTNKLMSYEPSYIKIYRSSDGSTLTEATEYGDNVKKALVVGDGQTDLTVSVNNYLVIEIQCMNYVSLELLYLYNSTAGTYLQYQIEASHNKENWTTFVSYGDKQSSWPGHTVIRHNSIWFNPTAAAQYNYIRLWIKCTKQSESSTYTTAHINKLQWWGGYPSGRRTYYSVDYNKNYSFPAAINAIYLQEGGTALSARYLGISAKAADSSKLNGQETSYYLNYNNFTNKPTLGTAAAANTGTSSGNVPVLDSNGKLNSSVVPAIAITDTFVVNSQSAMLALTAQVGDVCVRTDLKKSFILKTAGASTLANWQELLTPTDAVSSVNGKTGAVTLSASDVGALPSSTTYVSTVNGASGAITNVAKTNVANTFTGNNTFSGAFSATDGGSISADSGDVILDVSPSGIDLNSRYGVNIYASERGYISAYEPIQYQSGVAISSGSDLVPKSYVDNKTYVTSIATSSGTNQLTLAFGTKYALTAGGTSYVFTMPSNPNTNQTVKAGSTTFGANAAVAIAAGTRITVTPNATNNTITIATSATADSAITNTQIDGLF